MEDSERPVDVRPGTKLGAYEILSPIGKGGMGEVFRARDTKLGREVAIKTLPPEVASDPERLARFEREAQVLASLNHPHIAAIHGIEEVEDQPFLVLELVEGEDLAERLQRSALPLDEVLEISRQIAEALEEAHDRGIVHRDLKPANIKLTPNGTVKVLDFGLAKAFATELDAAPELSQSPTMTRNATQAGTLLGTAAYMSPEQARGKPVDRRADIWAFGCVLYELLTSKQSFRGETVTDVLASIVKEEPDWEALPQGLPLGLRDLLRRCLRKDPRQRVRDMGDVRITLTEQKDQEENDVASTKPEDTKAARHSVWPFAGAGLLMGLVIAAVASLSFRKDESRVMRLTLGAEALGGRGELSLAVSADGRRVAYIEEGVEPLRVRSLDTFEWRVLEGTEGARHPFFSPDGEWLAFQDMRSRELKRVHVDGGAPETLTDLVGLVRGGAWSSDGWIYFSQAPGTQGTSSLFRARDSGDEPELVLQHEGKTLAVPQVIRDEALLFISAVEVGGPPPAERTSIEALDLATGERKIVLEGHTLPLFFPPGHLLATSPSNELMAFPFDTERLEVVGPGRTVLSGVAANRAHIYSVADNGTLIIAVAEPNHSELLWVDRDGTSAPMSSLTKRYGSPSFSSDGSRLALRVGEQTQNVYDVWIHEIPRDVQTPLTFGSGSVIGEPQWTPDGLVLFYAEVGSKDSSARVYRHPVDGIGERELLLTHSIYLYPSSMTPDGQTLLLRGATPGTHFDIYSLALDGTGKLEPVIQTSFNDEDPRLTPDGQFLAYVSDKSGRSEVYLRAFPGPGRELQVSTRGGSMPRFSPGGDELFYREGETLMAVAFDAETVEVGLPEKLFELEEGAAELAAAPDGRFVMRRVLGGASDLRIGVITNLAEELR